MIASDREMGWVRRKGSWRMLLISVSYVPLFFLEIVVAVGDDTYDAIIKVLLLLKTEC